MPVINTKQLKIGMVTASDVLDRTGRLLFPANTRVEEKHYRILQAWGVHALSVKGATDEKESDELVAYDPVLVESCRKEVTKRFILSNASNPVIQEIQRLCICRMVQHCQQVG